jgi:hypothetical protein
MATKRTTGTSSSSSNSATETEPMPAQNPVSTIPEWMAQATAEGVKPEQALAFIGLGLMQKIATTGQGMPWMWSESEDGGQADLTALRQRLELTQLAIHTGAPLSTAEVTHLMGARPGSALVERGGLTARRLSRNVWTLSRSNNEGDRGFSSGFGGDGFRRRLGDSAWLGLTRFQVSPTRRMEQSQTPLAVSGLLA